MVSSSLNLYHRVEDGDDDDDDDDDGDGDYDDDDDSVGECKWSVTRYEE